MDVLVVNFQDAQHPYAGGAEVHLREVFGRLARRGHRVTLLCAGWPDAASRCHDGDIDIHRVGTRATFPFVAREYFRRHLDRRWDVIVEDLNKAALCVHRWSARPTALLVHHLFGRSIFAATNPAVAVAVLTLEAWLGRLYRDVPTIAVSRSTETDLRRRGFKEQDVIVIPNGVALSDVAPLHGHQFERRERSESPPFPVGAAETPARLIYLGRLQPYKRVDVLLRAVRRLADARVDVMLDVVGDGSCRSALHRLSRRLRIEPWVTFHGYVPHSVKQRLLARATLHVSTSQKEGWGLSVLEAGAWGVPTVAAHVAGLRDSVIEGRTGRFVRPNDVVDTADTIRRLLEDRDARAELGEGARRFAVEHSWDNVADRIEDFLADVATGARRRSSSTRQEQRDPFVNATLPRTGAGPIAFGVRSVSVRLSHEATTIDAVATIGARDPGGRRPAVELSGLPPRLRRMLTHAVGAPWLERRDTVTWELWGWPTPPCEWIQQTLVEALPGWSVEVHRNDPPDSTAHRPTLVRNVGD